METLEELVHEVGGRWIVARWDERSVQWRSEDGIGIDPATYRYSFGQTLAALAEIVRAYATEQEARDVAARWSDVEPDAWIEEREAARDEARRAALVAAVTDATGLKELRDALQGLTAYAEEDEAHEGATDLVDWVNLQTFGGEQPDSTEGVWSWDAERLLVGDDATSLRIIDRPTPEDDA